VNEHGSLRPRISVALLRLAAVDAAALRLRVADVRCGRYPSVPRRPAAHRPRIHPRSNGPGGHQRAAARLVRDRVRAGGQPVYARATVAGLPVLIVGGDRPYPHPLGGNEPAPSPGSLSSRPTRIACPCDQASPCLHAQALYAHVVSRVPRLPPGAPVAPPPWRRDGAARSSAEVSRQ